MKCVKLISYRSVGPLSLARISCRNLSPNSISIMDPSAGVGGMTNVGTILQSQVDESTLTRNWSGTALSGVVEALDSKSSTTSAMPRKPVVLNDKDISQLA